MHLRLTEDELATLVEMVSLATEIANVNRSEGAKSNFSRFEDMENKVLESAKHAGFGAWIEKEPSRDKYRVTEEFQQRSFFQECIDEFRDASFWEELMYRLSERDLMRDMGEDEWKKLDPEQQMKLTEPLGKIYWEKFSKDGISSVHLINRPD